MTEEIGEAVIAIPTDALPIALIREYSNSAQGAPRLLDDLKLLLPR